MNIIEVLEQEQLRSDIPDFRAGDTVKVDVTKEGITLLKDGEAEQVSE